MYFSTNIQITNYSEGKYSIKAIVSYTYEYHDLINNSNIFKRENSFCL